MLHPEPMPAGAVGSPAGETDTSCLNCFSRRVGLISICWVLLLMSAFSFFTTIGYMTVSSGGALAIFIIYFLVNMVDGVVSALLLLGIRDSVVRVRLNIWLCWNAAYAVLLLLLTIIDLSVVPITAGLGVMTGLQTVLMIGFRVYCLWAGWKFREELMSAPPPANQSRADLGAF